MSKLSEYEKKRLENIKENEALLRQLDIPTLPKTTIQTTTNNLRKHIPKTIKKEPKLPTRVSARLRGEKPEEQKRPLESTTFEDLEKAKKLKTIDSLSDEEKAKLLNAMQDALVKKMPNTEPTIKQESAVESDQALKKKLENLQIRHEWATVKVTPNRINGCLFHPSASKLLGCAVDTEGYLGIWDIQHVQEDGEPSVFQYKPHTRTVTDLRFNPTDPSKLFTSAYDGLIRIFDMNKAEFETLDLHTLTKYPITGFDITQDGHTIYFSTSDGEVGFFDIRANDEPTIYTPREKKIGCIHLNPVDQHLLAAASNDRTATIWDTRMWSDKGVGEPLQSIEHGYSVTSCYWSPSGDMLATTSYDDYIRIFNLSKETKTLDLKSAIKHNNHTGRWVTNFRARWNTNQLNDYQHLIIGNMNQTMDIYSGETGEEIIQLYDRNHITAIPSVCQFHPNTPLPAILAGNASGRMTFWN